MRRATLGSVISSFQDWGLRVQMEWRAAFQRARTFWGTLSDEQFLAWEAVGREHRTQSVLGRSSAIPGYLVSVSVNARLAMIGQPMVTTPPHRFRFERSDVALEESPIVATANNIRAPHRQIALL
jgi:hypothetical protein